MATGPRPSDSDTLHSILGQLEELNRLVGDIAARLAQGELEPGSPHDPGDAVPPGVAPVAPAPLTPGDDDARRALERLPAQDGIEGKQP